MSSEPGHERERPRRPDEPRPTRHPTPVMQPFRSRQVDVLLERAGALLATSEDVATTAQRLTDVLVPQFADWCAIPLIDPDGHDVQLAAVRARDSIALSTRAVLAHIFGAWAVKRTARFVVDDGREPSMNELVTTDWLRAHFSDAAVRSLQGPATPRSLLLLPLTLEERCLGAILLLVTSPARPPYGDGDLRAARRLAVFAASAVRNARIRETLTEELARRRRIEDSLRESLATIGTLSSGLGHDLGNVLHALRMRLDSMEQMELSEHAAADVRAITGVMEYLQRLTNGLRLLAGDVHEVDAGMAVTRLRAWWEDVQRLLHSVLPHRVILRWEVPDTLPPLRIPPVALTQVVFNLLQYAGQSLGGRPDAMIRIWARRVRGADAVRLGIEHNGSVAGGEAARDVLRTSVDHARPASGVGLPLAAALVERAGGRISVASRETGETAFIVRLGLVDPRRRPRRHGRTVALARVTIADPRTHGVIASLVRRGGFRVSDGKREAHRGEQLWITDLDNVTSPERLLEYVTERPSRMAIVVRTTVPPAPHPRIRAVPAGAEIEGLAGLLTECRELALAEASGGSPEVPVS